MVRAGWEERRRAWQRRRCVIIAVARRRLRAGALRVQGGAAGSRRRKAGAGSALGQLPFFERRRACQHGYAAVALWLGHGGRSGRRGERLQRSPLPQREWWVRTRLRGSRLARLQMKVGTGRARARAGQWSGGARPRRPRFVGGRAFTRADEDGGRWPGACPSRSPRRRRAAAPPKVRRWLGLTLADEDGGRRPGACPSRSLSPLATSGGLDPDR